MSYVLFFLSGVSLIYGCTASPIDQAVTPTLNSTVASITRSPKIGVPSTARLPDPTKSSITSSTPLITLTIPNDKELSSTATLITSKIVLDPIQIQSPSAGSHVTSPIPVDIVILEGPSAKRLRLELIDETGNLRARQVVDLSRLPTPGDRYTTQLAFEIPGDSQYGLLVAILEDAPYEPVGINSSRLTLLTSGSPKIISPAWQAKVIDVQTPHPGERISGGYLTVSGLTSLDTDKPLRVQIVAQHGGVVGQRLARIMGTPGDAFKPFSTEIQYQIDQETPCYVIVFHETDPNATVANLVSLPAILFP